MDFNVYLTRRLFDLPNRGQQDFHLAETEGVILMAHEGVAVRRSARLAEKRRGAAPAPRSLVRGETSDEEDAKAEERLSSPIVGQSINDAEDQCQQVLSHFSAEEWCEAQGSDQCIQRIAELKAKWGDDCDVTALRRETPEVQMYGRWWSDIYRGKDGVCCL